MDVVSVSIVVGAVIAASAGALHFYDRFSKRGFYQQTRMFAKDSSDRLAGLLSEIGTEIHSAREHAQVTQEMALATVHSMPDMSTLPTAIEAAVAGGIVKASTEVMKAQLEAPDEGVPPGVQAMGTDAAAQKALTKSLKAAIGKDMLGPYGAILQEWAPTVHVWLSEHPESVEWALNQPFVQNLIRKVATMVPSSMNATVSSGWGT